MESLTREDLAHVVEATPYPVVVLDDARVYVGCNEAACVVFGLTRAELLGRAADEVTPTSRLPMLDVIWDSLMSRGAAHGSYVLEPSPGRQVTVWFSALANVTAERHLVVFGEQPPVSDGAPGGEGELLTPRQRETLALAAEGYTNQEIGDRLFLTAATVETHLRLAMERLGARNRTHAVALAMARGLLRRS